MSKKKKQAADQMRRFNLEDFSLLIYKYIWKNMTEMKRRQEEMHEEKQV